jgi:hypothetical protein
MKPKPLIGCFFLILSLLSCASHPRVLFDFDQKEDFSRFSSFAFYPLPGKLAAEVSVQHFDVIKSAAIRELQAKGFTFATETEMEGADLLIAIHIESRQSFNITLWGYHYARYDDYWRGDEYWGGDGIDEHAASQGTLVLDIVRADEEELIWRGVRAGAVPRNTSGPKLEAVLDRAVADILQTFPPRRR